MNGAWKLPRWLRLYARFLAIVLLIGGLAVHVLGSLAVADSVNPVLGLAMLAFLWPVTGILAVSVGLLWLASAMGFLKLGRFFLSLARTSQTGS